MTGSYVSVTPGTGVNLATGPTYSEGGRTVQDEKTIAGLPYLATYVAAMQPAITSAGTHLFELMAGSSLIVNVHRIEVNVWAASGGANLCQFGLYRLSTAGTGGTAVTSRALDPADAAAAASCMSIPSVNGAEAGNIWAGAFSVPASSQTQNPALFIIDYESRLRKPLRIAAGTSNGIALKNITSVSSASLAIMVYWTESPF